MTAHISDDTEFVSAIDYGSFPSLESSYVAPLYELVKLGPELSVSLHYHTIHGHLISAPL